ncbi:G6F8U7 (Putative uncharacterized protein) [Lactobacillus equicursoris 66c]|uniref:Uncharacterized protein n=2 Tax=Lactobacillus equicursoris TaxID=420645 RepID=K0NPU6_9LACO|nr:hypothetical protein [Lactobacillus equicursoris]MDD6407627.1 hypothetical protein [Lactobacillus equicursoris]CCK82888.1 G6F8U7 (Putative uncharacterized protein) [Lactobacillus equicursoris 66c]
MEKTITKKYFVTLVFTLLALLNLLSSWGSLGYRLAMVAVNLIGGFGMEYLVNQKAPMEKYNFWKGCIGLILLGINVIWILLAFFAK